MAVFTYMLVLLPL